MPSLIEMSLVTCLVTVHSEHRMNELLFFLNELLVVISPHPAQIITSERCRKISRHNLNLIIHLSWFSMERIKGSKYSPHCSKSGLFLFHFQSQTNERETSQRHNKTIFRCYTFSNPILSTKYVNVNVKKNPVWRHLILIIMKISKLFNKLISTSSWSLSDEDN